MIFGDKVILRAWMASDLPALHSLRNNLLLQQQLMAYPKGNSLDQVMDWLSTRTKSSDTLFFIISCKSSNKALGSVQTNEIDFLNGVGKLGICIAPESQKKGYGGEAIKLLETYLRDVFQLRKLILEVLAENNTAVGLYTTHGYREVGRFYAHFYIGNKYSDVVIMEKLLCL